MMSTNKYFVRTAGGLLLTLLVLAASGCVGKLQYSIDLSEEPVSGSRDLTVQPVLQWSAKMISPPVAIEVLNQDLALILSYRGEIYLWDLNQGQRQGRVWQPYRQPISNHCIDGNRLYFSSIIDGLISAYDFSLQKKLWRNRKLKAPGAIAVIDSLVFYQEQRNIVAGNAANGKFIARRALPVDFASEFYISGGTIAVFSTTGNLHRFTTGLEPLEPLSLDLDQSLSAAITGDRIAAGDAHGRLVVCDLAAGQLIYATKLDGPIYTSPLINDELVICAHGSGFVSAINPESGELQWQFQGQGLVNQPLLIAGNVIIVPFARGRIVALDRLTGRELWHHDTEYVIRSLDLTSDGLLIADRRNRLHYLR
ncbi:MAG: PQQ-binding-like beta-propeller repeat protein [Candidatus Neomarinimicrobiota bacterium]